MKRIKIYIANLKISSKIWLCMFSIGLVLALFLGVLSSWYFSRLYQEDTYAQTADSLQIGSQALNDSFGILLTNVIDFASTSDFTRIVEEARAGVQSHYGKNTALIQDPMSNLTLSNPLMDSIAVLGKNGEFYCLFTNTLNKSVKPSDCFGWDLSPVNGITWLSVRHSPFIKNNSIVPVIIPITQLKDTRYLHIAATPEEADVLIILMLDSKRIAQRLALSDSSYAERTLYIANERGENLSLDPSSPFHDLVSSEETIKRVAAGQEDAPGLIEMFYDNMDYSLYGTNLGYCGLKLVSILPKTLLHERILRMNAFILLIAVLGLILTTFLALMLSRFVTRPFNQLITNVKKIENDNYDTPYQMKYQDEIGHLNMAINSMYATIRQQFEKIKQTERAKYRSEIQLLSEQINPHFLYNTLECINMEVLGGHKEAASSMITSLGDFLRIGLSYGSELIPITKELTHVKAYIDIMNHRFNRKIEFTCTVDPELSDMMVLKSILQPLAENSIRHGFDVDVSFYEMILLPAINIEVKKENGFILLEVSDNGRGIDIEKAASALHPESSEGGQKQHVGLNNIYQRLSAYYGEVSIDFESIPYFKNTVRITLPGEG